MDINTRFGKALRLVRKYKGLSQEDFSDVSSRTYVSALERGLKSPTLEKVEMLAREMDIDPLVLLTIAFSAEDEISVESRLGKVSRDVREVQTSGDASGT